MDVSPETIRTVEFRERLRGYNQDDVDQFLERMAAGVEILQQRLRDATQRAARAEERPPGEGEDALRRTLALAQRTADLAVEEGREQAARLVQAAQAEAHDVVAAARGEAEALLADAEQRAAQLVEEAEAQARGEVRRLETRREQLEGEMAALERHVAQARARAYTSLTDAARQIEYLGPAPISEPMPEPAPEQVLEPAPELAPAPEAAPGTTGADAMDLSSETDDPERLTGPSPEPSGPMPFEGASVQS